MLGSKILEHPIETWSRVVGSEVSACLDNNSLSPWMSGLSCWAVI